MKSSHKAPLVEFHGVSKWYGQVQGVFHVDLQIPQGIVGILGPNGCGKSTLLKILVGEIQPSQGRVEVLGRPVWNNLELRRKMGYCPDSTGRFYSAFTGRTFLETMAALDGWDSSEVEDRADDILREMDLVSVADRPIYTYSGGMAQRLRFAQCLLGEPEILILDEPLQGADPLARQTITATIRKLADQGVHSIISSNVLHEIEAVTDQIVVLMEGKVLAHGVVEEIRDLIQTVPRQILVKLDQPRGLARILSEKDYVKGLHFEDDQEQLAIVTTDLQQLLLELPSIILDHNWQIYSLESRDESLEKVFYLLTQGLRRQGRER